MKIQNVQHHLMKGQASTSSTAQSSAGSLSLDAVWAAAQGSKTQISATGGTKSQCGTKRGPPEGWQQTAGAGSGDGEEQDSDDDIEVVEEGSATGGGSSTSKRSKKGE